jgi:glutamate 5-kinase
MLFYLKKLGRGGMGSKIDAAMSAVAPGSKCSACVVASGADLNSIRAVFGPYAKFGNKGTMFLTPGSALEKQALKDMNEAQVSDSCKTAT